MTLDPGRTVYTLDEIHEVTTALLHPAPTLDELAGLLGRAERSPVLWPREKVLAAFTDHDDIDALEWVLGKLERAFPGEVTRTPLTGLSHDLDTRPVATLTLADVDLLTDALIDIRGLMSEDDLDRLAALIERLRGVWNDSERSARGAVRGKRI